MGYAHGANFGLLLEQTPIFFLCITHCSRNEHVFECQAKFKIRIMHIKLDKTWLFPICCNQWSHQLCCSPLKNHTWVKSFFKTLKLTLILAMHRALLMDRAFSLKTRASGVFACHRLFNSSGG